jgi:hypothetical protein
MDSVIKDPIEELLSYSIVKPKKAKPSVAKFFDLTGTKIKTK